MSAKRKGQYTLSEALDILEATTVQNYPDNGTGVASDDDRPPGNIVYGDKYKRSPYFNRLTSFKDIWDLDDSDWKWDEFEKSMGMEDLDNYSDTLQGMEDLLPKKTWNNIWKRMKNVPNSLATKRFIQAGQHWRKGGEDQTGDGDENYVDIDAGKSGKLKDTDVTNEKLIEKINKLVL